MNILIVPSNQSSDVMPSESDCGCMHWFINEEF
jgi:hypothetical protein